MELSAAAETEGVEIEGESEEPEGGLDTESTESVSPILPNWSELSGEGDGRGALWIWAIALAALLTVLAVAVTLLSARRRAKRRRETAAPSVPCAEEQSAAPAQTESPASESYSAMRTSRGGAAVRAVGKVHHIGRRQAQQDSLGVTACAGGVLAVVADGMGGLADGDKVSQKTVLTMLQDCSALAENQMEGALYRTLAHVNREVNSMLGTAGQYKSGSTVVAAMVTAGYFQWISVGDSRIYLYRGQHLFQINREHIHEADLWRQAVAGEISFAEISEDPQRKHVSSFIGMGELRYIDGSIRPVPIYPGDRLLLMSDGVFNTLTEQEICSVLSREGEAPRAAAALESLVLARQNPRQDNFTAVILDI